MTPKPYNDVRDIALTTDADLLDRVTDLIERAFRRQLWLMFLDEDARQLPIVMPSYVPRRPETGALEPFAEFLGSLFEEVGATSVIITYERVGAETITDGDRAWLRLVHAACAAETIPLRGPLLAHSRGVRWVAPEDFLALD